MWDEKCMRLYVRGGQPLNYMSKTEMVLSEMKQELEHVISTYVRQRVLLVKHLFMICLK